MEAADAFGCRDDVRPHFLKNLTAVKKIILAAMLMGLSFAAQAQSSVTLFGLLDVGVTYTSNAGGHSSIAEQSGIQAPDLIGVRGTEDLGGGYAAIFVMDGMFSINTGAAESGGGIFGHESYVGISTPMGTVTLGNQFDYMNESLSVARYGNQIPYVSLYQLPDGPFSKLGTPLGTFDYSRLAGGQASPNTIKFTSKTYDGLDFGAMYGFSNIAGEGGTDNMSSFALNYASGPVRLDAAYTFAHDQTLGNGTGGIRNWGAGGRYDFGRFAFDALYTNTDNTFNGAQVSSIEIGGLYSFAPDFFAYAQYIYAKGNDVLTDNRANQIGLTLDYLLSRRTDVYVNGIYQHASGGEDAFAAISGSSTASTTGSQTIVRVGIRHLF